MPVRLTDVAAAVGLHLATVSRALRDDPRIKPETREKVRAAADRLGYRTHWGARALAEGRSRTVWLLVEGLDNPVEREPARWAGRRLLDRGYDLLLAQHYGDPAVYARLLDRLAHGGADGALVVSGWSHPDGEADRRLAQAGFPFVYVDRAVPGVPVPVVTTDNEAAAEGLVRTLVEAAAAQAQPLTWLVNDFRPERNVVEADRHRGARAAARALGLAEVPSPLSGRGAWVASSAWDYPVDSQPWVGVFDQWHRQAVSTVRVVQQDFRAMGEVAADTLLALLEGRAAPPLTRIPALPPALPTDSGSNLSSS